MAQTQLDSPDTKTDHDAKGRFRPGNKGGPGNPHARHAGELRRSLLQADEKDLRQVIRSVIEKAKVGDVAAAKLVLQYTLGTPRAMPDPDRLDVEEWKLIQESGVSPEEVVAQSKATPVKEVLAANTESGHPRSPIANASNGGAAPGNAPMANGAIGIPQPHALGPKPNANGSNGAAKARSRARSRKARKANGSIGDKRRKKKKPPGRRRNRG